MDIRKGIILAGGTGSRLYPLTSTTNKQLLPLYDKPVLYYPLSTLMLAGIRDILIIAGENDLVVIQRLLGTGQSLGIHCSYRVQTAPNGLPEAFILGEKFLAGEPSMLILGDNFFYGDRLARLLKKAMDRTEGAHIFVHTVENPSAYGILNCDETGCIQSIVEKPQHPTSSWAITGLYIFDGQAPQYAKQLKPSARHELEIVDLIQCYWQENRLSYSCLGRGFAWYDAGTPDALLDVSAFVRTIEMRQGLLVASPEEIALKNKFISAAAFRKRVDQMPNCLYKRHLEKILKENHGNYQNII